MHRVPEVIDCWFDSGAMPFAQHHYPFENQDVFKRQFPAQFISEAVDQTRGWFYSLMAESTLLFNRSPFENVIVMEMCIRDSCQGAWKCCRAPPVRPSPAPCDFSALHSVSDALSALSKAPARRAVPLLSLIHI